MTNPMKQHGFLSSLPRLFTRAGEDAYDLIHFREREQSGDDFFPAVECTDGWSNEAAALLASEAAFAAAPAARKAIEENTVPSWLWRHESLGRKKQPEGSVQQIFDRAVGAATYAAWKEGLFPDETEARLFFDETRYALAARTIAFEPSFFAGKGAHWAYGLNTTAAAAATTQSTTTLSITNQSIDAIVRGSTDKALRSQWQRAVQPRQPVSLRFADTTQDWEASSAQAVPVLLDLLAFRHNDGSINIEALCHATRLTVALADLLGAPAGIAIGFGNLAPLLMALGLSYDSEAARMTASAIAAIVTATAYAASAHLAALRGMAPQFAAGHDVTLRALRNHRRAAYGDTNDYEKIGVLPQPLRIVAGLDLPLVASARRLWDEALELVRIHGLRQPQVTAMAASARLALFSGCLTQGVEAVPALSQISMTADETFSEAPLPCLIEGLARLDYGAVQTRSIIAHAVGHRSLVKAPAINAAALRAHGFDSAAIARVEAYVPQVNALRLAFTPWIVGYDYCRDVLKIPAKKLDSASFDLLRHLGFSDSDVAAANAYCYGHSRIKGAKDLRADHAGIFVRRDDVGAEALLRMAAAVQGFVSGDVAVSLALPQQAKADKAEALVLSAWRQGLKQIDLSFAPESAEAQPAARKTRKARRAVSVMQTQAPKLAARRAKPRMGLRLASLTAARSKTSGAGRSKAR